MSSVDRLPRRLPVGTRYVVEGVPGADGELTIVSRTVVLPNGTAVPLPVGAPRGTTRKGRRQSPASVKVAPPGRKRKPRRV